MIEKQFKFIKPVWRIKERFDSYMPDSLAVISVAASVVSMVFLGPILVMLFYALWLPRIYYKGQWIIKPTKEVFLPAIIIIYSIISTLWSQHPSISLRIGFEFASAILCVLIMARIVRISAFIKGVTLGMCIALIIVLFHAGRIQTEYTLIGSLGSKNQVGVNAEIGFYCAMMCWFIFNEYWKKFLIALPAMVFCGWCLLLSQSATSMVSLILIIVISLIAYCITKIPRKLRMPILIIIVFFMTIVMAVGMFINLDKVGFEIMDKDATLTGRTYLWEEGIRIGLNNSVFGVGLGAFWVSGTLEAEKIWFRHNIANRSGFHFHNLFINVFVELGIVGVILWVAMYTHSLVGSLLYLLRNENGIESIFYVGIIFMYIIRSMVEVDTTGPYGTGVLLFFYTIFRVTSQKKSIRSIN